MANVAFGYVVTQDETIVPTVFNMGTSGAEIISLSGAVTDVDARPLGEDVWLVGLNGKTDAEMLARARVFVEAASGIFIGGGAGGFRASDATSSVDSANEGSFVPGTWTAT